jgi:geranylgeranyl diphosphate synthase type I
VRKQEALSILTETALFTGCGELDELLQTLRPLSEVDPKDIYRIYDWKTGHYSFTSPLTMGATLAGASRKDIRLFRQVGQDLGRAFQIRDDLLDLYGDGDRFGKPGLLDLQEGKKTLPVWYAYHNCPAKHKARMRVVLEQPGASKKQIREIAGIIDSSGAADYAEGEMEQLVKKSVERLRKTAMRPTYRDFLIDYVSKMLTPPART